MTSASTELATALESLSGGLLLVVTGAGVSRASGIPTFRGSEPDAVWKQSDVELATREYFARDPAGQWRWYLRRFDAVEAALPNPAHHALVALETWKAERGGFLLVTQNIDTLHEQAGSRRLIKVHGSSDRVRCVEHGCANAAPHGSLARAAVDVEAFRQQPTADNLPRCPLCGGLLRAHVLFFDEYYQDHVDYRVEDVLIAAEEAGMVLFVGTSLSVGITDLIGGAAQRQEVPVYSLDPRTAPPRHGQPPIRQLADRAERALPDLCARLGAA